MNRLASEHPEYTFGGTGKINVVDHSMDQSSKNKEFAWLSILVSNPCTTRMDMTKIINQIRKWSCYFDGKAFLSFLEIVEELRQGYGFSGDQLLMGLLPELSRGETLL